MSTERNFKKGMQVKFLHGDEREECIGTIVDIFLVQPNEPPRYKIVCTDNNTWLAQGWEIICEVEPREARPIEGEHVEVEQVSDWREVIDNFVDDLELAYWQR